MEKKIVCFGAGKFGILYARAAALQNIAINCFVDNDTMKWGSECEGIKIFPPSYLAELADEDIEVVIAVSKSAGLDKVVVQLENMGFKYGKNIISHAVQMEKDAEKLISKKYKNAKVLDLGNSPCLKYYVETPDGKPFFLRVSTLSQYERRKREQDLMSLLLNNGIFVSQMVALGKLNSCIYTLSDWIFGENIDTALLKTNPKFHYNLGIKSGQSLKKMHSLSLENKDLDSILLWNIDDVKKRYYENGLRSVENDIIFNYLDKHKNIIKNRPLSLVHGDYDIKNQMLTPSNDIIIIDFDKTSFADALSDMGMIVYSALISKDYAIGQLHGYFNGNPSKEIWQYIAYYTMHYAAYHALRTVSQTKEVQKIYSQQNASVLSWFNNMKSLMPNWYKNYLGGNSLA
ncbi:MAG: phosphotransferase [Defluviitaleaceae bacterium]|nr:phosphotransferase [Defluviitaleaceae bacterium]